jgi:hypothetical protein
LGGGFVGLGAGGLVGSGVAWQTLLQVILPVRGSKLHCGGGGAQPCASVCPAMMKHNAKAATPANDVRL